MMSGCWLLGFEATVSFVLTVAMIELTAGAWNGMQQRSSCDTAADNQFTSFTSKKSTNTDT
jgi:hypothetical protein